MELAKVTVLFAAGFLAFLVKQWRLRRRASGYPTPPQRRGWPLIGNLGQMPAKTAWLTFIEWGKELDSDLIYTNVAGKHFLIINSFEKAIEILDKRSGIYSNRPPSVTFDELMGWGYLLSRLPYGDAWREQRRLFQQHLRPAKAIYYRPKIVEHVRRSMNQFERRPTDTDNVLRHTVGGIAISLAYGLATHPFDDPHVKFAEMAMQPLRTSNTPGVYWINVFPFLKHLPAWFPGATVKRSMVKQRAVAEAFREKPFHEATSLIATSQAQSASFTSLALEQLAQSNCNSERDLQMVKDTAAIVYAAGSDTTSNTISFWIRVMLRHPEIQKKIQQELDEVLQGRLPDFGDEEQLPWTRASLMESMRLYPVSPTGITHSSNGDDIFDGYFIPHGTTIIPNSWAMLHDEKRYPDPMSFNPARFIKDGKINPDVLNPNQMVFGYGRRACPGLHIAEDVSFITVATILSLFDICNPVDAHGEPIEPSMDITPGIIVRPVPFECVLKVRNATAQSMLNALEYANS